ncbi:helix-turn-helix domain-containing protein [Clostridium culturomicium]|uniref:helix-turn-helix domain-containing protein n=1 Tax=Clostridium culturomicium TaxID=1499683 RepID=UPI0038577D24
MNQLQIGKFISECRKENKLTQVQLAEKLGITNRAVSKWETGNSIPDASIMIELCEILNISVNELLCGKRLNEEENHVESEKNTLTMLVAKKDLENMKILAEILILAGIIIAITLTAVIAVSTIQKVITLMIGCFIWGYGLWLKIKLKKAISKIL